MGEMAAAMEVMVKGWACADVQGCVLWLPPHMFSPPSGSRLTTSSTPMVLLPGRVYRLDCGGGGDAAPRTFDDDMPPASSGSSDGLAVRVLPLDALGDGTVRWLDGHHPLGGVVSECLAANLCCVLGLAACNPPSLQLANTMVTLSGPNCKLVAAPKVSRLVLSVPSQQCRGSLVESLDALQPYVAALLNGLHCTRNSLVCVDWLGLPQQHLVVEALHISDGTKALPATRPTSRGSGGADGTGLAATPWGCVRQDTDVTIVCTSRGEGEGHARGNRKQHLASTVPPLEPWVARVCNELAGIELVAQTVIGCLCASWTARGKVDMDIGATRQRQLHGALATPLLSAMLLHGPTGTGTTERSRNTPDKASNKGKSALLALVAKHSGAECVTLSAGDVFGHEQPAAYLEKTFATVLDGRRCLLLLDDIDALCPAVRIDGGSRAEAVVGLRVIDHLTRLFYQVHDHGCFVLAATSRRLALNPLLYTRAGIQMEVEMKAPTPQERLVLLDLATRHMPIVDREPVLKSVARATHGFVGADLIHLCRETALAAARAHGQEAGALASVAISAEHFERALARIAPSSMQDQRVGSRLAATAAKHKSLVKLCEHGSRSAVGVVLRGSRRSSRRKRRRKSSSSSSSSIRRSIIVGGVSL
eukprot:m.264773 g.264773  ORF g.264773 m.264773 type:complete len:648 (-) comp19252_c0_seq4:1281-3224(-)